MAYIELIQVFNSRVFFSLVTLNFSLSQHFLNTGKTLESDIDKVAAITDNFHNNKIKLAEYNLQDCKLVWDIFEKINLLDFLLLRSQITGLELDRAGGSIAAFVNLYLPRLHRNNYVSPNPDEALIRSSPGGYVMNSKPGFYKNIILLDFKSLYPSIIRTFKIDPLGLIEGLKSTEEAIAGFRGGYFSRDKHILPHIITKLWQQREIAKQQNDKSRSQAIKILMNSFYGVLGASDCPFFDHRLASSITMMGHKVMKMTRQWIEADGFDVIYGDTDSIFIKLAEHLDETQVQEKAHSIVNLINHQWSDYISHEYNITNYMEIEFETHFKRFLMPTIRGSSLGTKKRYAGLTSSLEGEQLVFKGLEFVRSDWTELAKQFQKELYTLIFNDHDPSLMILDTVQQTLAGQHDHKLIYRKKLRKPLDEYIKNIPPHVKAAKIASMQNEHQQFNEQYFGNKDISYFITVHGPQPEHYLTSAIDYKHYIDKQIKPVADAILPFVGLSFDEMVKDQLSLF